MSRNALSRGAAGTKDLAVRLGVVERSTTTKEDPVKIVAYLRVSSADVENGQKIDLQRTAIRRWAKASGHRIVEWCVDDGISGTKGADERPGLIDALAALRERRVDGLVVRDYDRLAREVGVQEAVLAEAWRRNDVHVFTVLGEILRDDPDDPMRTIMRKMMGLFAELDRLIVVKRLRDGRKAKADRGGHAIGAYPYGQGPLGPIEAEQAALARMFALRDGGASTYIVAATLTREGHPTKRGGTWSSASVSRILSRQAAAA
jgi:DNA invertase Pin-like site-specific DNA recombinase